METEFIRPDILILELIDSIHTIEHRIDEITTSYQMLSDQCILERKRIAAVRIAKLKETKSSLEESLRKTLANSNCLISKYNLKL